jgi:hypothetical protein
MRACEVGAALGGTYGVDCSARETEPWFARAALCRALAATGAPERERVLVYFLLAHGHAPAHARVALECARTSIRSVLDLLVDESALY